ncbi:MAG: serine hydrolase domain-containing protein [Planctomycetaceae bacterium]
MTTTGLINEIFRQHKIPFADVLAGDEHGCFLECSGGTADPLESTTVERRYLIASLTKSVVATMFVQLASEGYFYLNEPVRNFLPGFHRGSHRTITLRHLLTHSSGLPDMLPNNHELRASHAGLGEFVAGTAAQEPGFVPGTATSYCSMGFALLAAIMEQRLNQSCAEILRSRLFEPLGMRESWLGLPDETFAELMPTVVPCELPEWQANAPDWNWNSAYWRKLGAPWGGMISTGKDLGRLLQCLLNNGQNEKGQSVVSPAVAIACTRNQTIRMSNLPETDRKRRPWGFGWRLNWPDHSGCFSDFLPSSAFGHWGATGTLMWVDRTSSRWCVILTNQPFEKSQTAIQRTSNIVAASGCRERC